MTRYGITTFCFAPGGRSAPLVFVLSQSKGLKLFSFFEERSAGFFALGLSKKNKAPVALISTSGTATAEFLPSVIEAYYSHIPLVLITADRPSSYRKTGAPQSIEQVGIFSHYVEKTWDLEKNKPFDLSSWTKKIPCHINICFDEPLIDKKIKSLVFSLSSSSFKKKIKPGVKTKSKVSFDVNKSSKNFSSKSSIKQFFLKVKKPLFILAELPESIIESTEKTLSAFSFPIYAEALSGLRESQILKPLILKSGEKILTWLVLNKKIDGILRIGRRPCTRFWRDLEKTYSHIPVLSVSDQAYTGLSRNHPVLSFPDFFEWSNTFFKKECLSSLKAFKASQILNQKKHQEKKLISKKLSTLNSLKNLYNKKKHLSLKQKNTLDIFKKDQKQIKILNKLLKKYPLSEPALIRSFSQKIPDHSLLFLGNSLPIREWNLGGSYEQDKKIKYVANRGANGIDGLLSSFLGSAEPDRENWCLIGDLSALYDLSAPWVLKSLPANIKVFFGIINNSGGRIFSSLFSDPIFLNAHNLQFKNWAKMWSLNYYELYKWEEVFSFSSPAVIEIKVNFKQTRSFMQEYRKFMG